MTPTLDTDLLTNDDRDSMKRGGSVLISHANGRVSFLAGRPLRLPLARTAAITRLESTGVGPMTASECTVRESTTCEARALAQTKQADAEAPICTTQVVKDTSASNAGYRIAFHGAIASGRDTTLRWTRTSTAQTIFSLAQSARERVLVRVGDGVFVVARASIPCGTSVQTVVATGSVAAVGSDAVELSFANTTTLSRARSCDGSLGIAVATFEIYPGDDAVAVQQIVGISVAKVIARATLAELKSGEARTGTQTIALPVAMSLTSPGGAPCVVDSIVGQECATSRDCFGLACEPSSVPTCFGRCRAACDPSATTCVTDAVVRRCAGVEFVITGAEINVADMAAQSSGLESAFQPAIPEDVVFSPMRQSWFVSFPGARGLGEIQTGSSGGFVIRAVR